MYSGLGLSRSPTINSVGATANHILHVPVLDVNKSCCRLYATTEITHTTTHPSIYRSIYLSLSSLSLSLRGGRLGRSSTTTSPTRLPPRMPCGRFPIYPAIKGLRPPEQHAGHSIRIQKTTPSQSKQTRIHLRSNMCQQNILIIMYLSQMSDLS